MPYEVVAAKRLSSWVSGRCRDSDVLWNEVGRAYSALKGSSRIVRHSLKIRALLQNVRHCAGLDGIARIAEWILKTDVRLHATDLGIDGSSEGLLSAYSVRHSGHACWTSRTVDAVEGATSRDVIATATTVIEQPATT